MVPKESTGAVQPEGQLAVVIGKTARNVPRENALDRGFGYSIGNDVSQRVVAANGSHAIPRERLSISSSRSDPGS